MIIKMKKTLLDKIFRVDKKIVTFNLVKWLVVMEILFLILKNDFMIIATLKDKQFWVISFIVSIILLVVVLRTIFYERVEFRGNELTSYFNTAESVNILDFVSVKENKTPYMNYLGFEYKDPKGIFVRFLLPYVHYSPKTLQEIMQEILRINPNIQLEDNLVKQIFDGTYKHRVVD